jgi:hypothetical protein
MAPTRKRSFAPRPHKASLAEDKGCTQTGPFRSRSSGGMRHPRGWIELVSGRIEETDMKHIGDLPTWHSKINQSQTTFICSTRLRATTDCIVVANDRRRRYPRPAASHLHRIIPHGGHRRKVVADAYGEDAPVRSLPQPPLPNSFGTKFRRHRGQRQWQQWHGTTRRSSWRQLWFLSGVSLGGQNVSAYLFEWLL